MAEIENVEKELTAAMFNFLEAAADDPRISPIHICVYIVLLHYHKKQEYKIPISVYARDIIKQAKISGNTYHKCILDLHRYGFIHYIPSYNPVLGSLVYPLKFEKNENVYHQERTGK